MVAMYVDAVEQGRYSDADMIISQGCMLFDDQLMAYQIAWVSENDPLTDDDMAAVLTCIFSDGTMHPMA
jgi:hypothetical protein